LYHAYRSRQTAENLGLSARAIADLYGSADGREGRVSAAVG
jgi:hypothetical protein